MNILGVVVGLMISYVLIILRPSWGVKFKSERGEIMDHKSPKVSWDVFGFDIVLTCLAF